MDHKRKAYFGLFSVGALTGAIACTSTTTTTETPSSTPDGGKSSSSSSGSSSTSSSGSTSSSTSSSGGGTSTSSSGGTDDSMCTMMTTLKDCGDCCIKNHDTGYKTFVGALLDCACNGTGADGGTGPCATDCADTICNATPKAPDTTCNTCLQNSVGQGGACNDSVASACEKDTDCVAEQKCIGSCPKQ